jgi:sigma-B regulation protein RsbU (phosphoserine phosphatase)
VTHDGSVPPDVQAALDQAPCGLLRLDRHGAILQANAVACDWLGYSRGELQGRKLQDLMTIGGRIFHQTHLHPLFQMQGSFSEVKLDLVRRDGQAIPVVINAQRHEQDGVVFSEVALFVARDRDTYERELLRARRRLEDAVSQEKDRALLAEQMVAIVSHDLRNPLQTIQMGAMLLMRSDPTPQQRAVLERISRAGDRARRLIADLLDFTQARLGQGIAVGLRPIALHKVVADVIDELGQAYPGRRLVHAQAGEGECVADADRVSQVVGNLVSNAMTYGDVGAAVTVRSEIAPREFRVSVHNTGAPIPPELQDVLFEPMVRGSAEAGTQRSVGLGLFIVREIAKAHGGRVRVESTAAGGTTFEATFPRPA